MPLGLSRLIQGTNPLLSSITALAGGIAGGGIYLSLPGAVFGLLLALFICALLAIATSAAGLTGEDSAPVASRPATINTLAGGISAPESQEEAALEPTETEAALMNAGRFADYHLAKAKRLFAAGNFKEAAYQASASLAHGSLPEAKELRQKAQAATRSG